MKLCIQSAVVILLMTGCSMAAKVNSDNKSSQTRVEYTGIVDDGFMKRYPYYLSSNGTELALDVVVLPKNVLRREHRVSGRRISVDGIEVLTEVSIDGVRYQTKREWADSNSDSDPFE